MAGIVYFQSPQGIRQVEAGKTVQPAAHVHWAGTRGSGRMGRGSESPGKSLQNEAARVGGQSAELSL